MLRNPGNAVDPMVRMLGSQGWIVLGLVAGAALAWRLSRGRSTAPARSLGPWDGEGSHEVDRGAAMAS